MLPDDLATRCSCGHQLRKHIAARADRACYVPGCPCQGWHEAKRPPAVRAAGGPEGSGRRGERSEPTNLNPSGSREGPGLPSMKVRYRTFLDPTQAPGRSRVVSEKLAGGLGLQTLTTEGTPEAAPGVRCPLCDRLSLRRVACGSCGGVAGGCIDCDGEAGWFLCDYADDDCTPTLYWLDPLGAPAVLP